MAQKYKVFFFGNVIMFTNNSVFDTDTKIFYKYTDIEDFRRFVFDYLAKTENCEVKVFCNNIENVWADFCSMFEVRQAAGGLVVNFDGKYLFIKRKGKWDIPKGHMEQGETSEQCGLREVEEECGISNMKIDGLICTTYHTYYIDNQPILKSTDWYLMRYDGSAILKPQTDEEITDAIWVEEAKIDDLLKDSFSSIPEVIKQLREIR